MEYVRTFVILAIFITLSVACVFNMIRHHKEEKQAKEEKRRKRSPFANKQEGESIETQMETQIEESKSDDNEV